MERRGPIFRWNGTRPFRDRSSRPIRARWWPKRIWAGCTIVIREQPDFIMGALLNAIFGMDRHYR
jgi:hypothetical protein